MSKHCDICPHHCKIGDSTFCGQNPSMDDKDVVKVSAVAVDPIEKKPLYHYKPGSKTLSIGTLGCNLKCLNCQNHIIAQPESPDSVGCASYSPEDIVNMARSRGLTSISWTYNENCIHPKWIINTARLARDYDIESVLVTNGYTTKNTLRTLVKYVDAVNVDVKSMRDDFYRDVCGGSLEPVLDSARYYFDHDVHVELTNLVIPGYNDGRGELEELVGFVRSLSTSVPLHLSRFYPQFRMSDVDETPFNAIEKAWDYAKFNGLKHVYPGNMPQSYRDNTYCKNCRSLLLKRNGYVVSDYTTDKNACANCNHITDIIF